MEYEDVVHEVSEEIKKSFKTGYPNRPAGLEDHYDFPTNFAMIGLDDIQSWVSKLNAWRGFLLVKVAYIEMELKAAKEVFNRKLASHSLKYPKQKYTKDQLEEIMVCDEPKMGEVRDIILKKEMVLSNLNRVIEMYNIQSEALKTAIYIRSRMVGQP